MARTLGVVSSYLHIAVGIKEIAVIFSKANISQLGQMCHGQVCAHLLCGGSLTRLGVGLRERDGIRDICKTWIEAKGKTHGKVKGDLLRGVLKAQSERARRAPVIHNGRLLGGIGLLLRLDNTVFLKLAHPAERLVKVKVGIPLHAIGQGDLDGLVCCRGEDGMNAQVEFPAFWKA